MAEAVVSLALETFRGLLLEEARFLSGVGDEVRALQTQLEDMKNLLKDADGKQHKSECVGGWIKQVRDLAYRAEDTIETYAVKVSSKRGRGFMKKLRRLSCFMNELYSRHQIGSEISQIKFDLAAVNQSMRDYGIRNIIQGETSTTNDNQQWKRQSFPHFKIGDCFVGKDDELKEIVSRLIDEKHRHHRVVSIWGMGGSGKTAIARKAYHHDRTKHFFQGFAWVCISQQCDIRSVLEDVLKQLKDGVTPGLSNRELIEELCQIQKAKSCIIVLDDLWKTDHWDGLKNAFLVEGLKSKILVTTRSEDVAAIGFSRKLGLLNMESGWELLKMKAFPEPNTPGCELTATDEGLEVLKKVLSCPHLHDLAIWVKIGKQLNKCGNCVSSSSIVELRLDYCEIEENPMEILGKLPELRRLYLWSQSFVGEEMVCPEFSFPRLKKLLLWDLRNLREWRVEEGAMPLLSQLTIDKCRNLMMLPDGLRFISSLKNLTILGMPDLKKRVLASEDEGGEGGEDFDKVRHVPSIIIY